MCSSSLKNPYFLNFNVMLTEHFLQFINYLSVCFVLLLYIYPPNFQYFSCTGYSTKYSKIKALISIEIRVLNCQFNTSNEITHISLTSFLIFFLNSRCLCCIVTFQLWKTHSNLESNT